LRQGAWLAIRQERIKFNKINGLKVLVAKKKILVAIQIRIKQKKKTINP